jgi:hypothetical protein
MPGEEKAQKQEMGLWWHFVVLFGGKCPMDKKQLSFQFNNNYVRNYTVGTPFVPCLPRQGYCV